MTTEAAYAPDLPIKPFLTLGDDPSAAWVAELTRAVVSNRARQPSALQWEVIRKGVRMLAANFLRLRKWGADATINYPRREAVWRGDSPQRPDWLKARSFNQIVTALLVHDYVKFTPGRRSPVPGLSRQTRLQPTPRLMALLDDVKAEPILSSDTPPPVVILRDGDKQPLSYDPTEPELASLIERTELINAASEGLEVLLHAEGRQPVRFAPDELRYVRVFNDGRWDRGGRFFSDIQQLPSRLRPGLKINGRATVEIDIRYAHPTMAYARLGLELPEDAYRIEPLYDLTRLYGDDYEQDFRPIAKVAFNILLNAGSRRGLSGCPDLAGLPPPFSPKFLIKEMEMKHASISSIFYKKAGLELMNLESKITEDVLISARHESVPIIAIHDSFVTTVEHEEWLNVVLARAFSARVGVNPKLKIIQ